MKKILQIPKVLFGILVVTLLSCTTLQAQSVQIISPNGGESWLGGSTRAITWTYTNVDNIRIEYSLDNGLTWLLISSSYPASALGINWVVPAIGSNQCKVRITNVLFFTQDESNTTFTIPEPIVLLSYPLGGESFGTGTGQYIEWSTVGVATVMAQYSTNNGATWTDIGTFPAGNNYCNWVAPSTVTSQTKIRVYNVENAINQASSPAVFSITNVPTIAPEKYRGGSNDGYKMASSLPDAITVTAPNGGETFYPTNVVNITWTFRNTDTVKIEYSLNNGGTWNLITAAVAADTQTYPWTIPNSPSTQCLIKVSDLGSALSDVSNAPFTINSAFVTLTYPNGGESFGEGTGQYIEWDFNAVATVLLEYSINNGTTWTSIGTAPASNKYANWVPPAGANSQCLIRISDSSTPLVTDTTDATFSITTAPVADIAKYRGGAYDGYSMAKNLPDNITVTSPNGGETWTGASTRTISWTYTNVDNVSVEFSLDDGITWTTLAANLPASQLSYSWTVPTTPSYLCRIRVKDLISPVSDTNDTAFIIPNSWVQVKYPNGGESFGGGTGQYIEWDYSFIQTIKLEYSINNGTTWSVIGTANAADKYANWVAPLDVSSQIVVRATDVNNALFTDTSDLVFKNFALPTIAPEKYRGGLNDGYSMYAFKDIYINVLKPNGGEIWGNGTIKNIDFSTLNLPTADLLKIEYSIDNESIWNTLATNIDRTASPYVWTIAASPSAIAKVRISNMDGTIFDKSDNFFTIANINGIVTNALGANSFCSGQTTTVSFTKNTTFNAGNKFIVQLSDAQGTFSGALINIGEITSQVPAPITVIFPAVYTSSSLYRIRVIATDTPTIGTDNGTNFTIRPLPTVNLGGQATICSGSNLTLNATNAGSTYLWSTGAITPTISVNSAGTYQVAVTNSCGTTTDAIVVQIKNSPVVNLGPDATICLNSALQLNAGNTDATYLWSTGATNSSISVVTPGTYTATATNSCGSNTDSITITNLPQITVDLGPDAGLCAGQNLVLNAGNPGSTYLWSTGATTQSITVTTPGNYTVGVTNSCGTVSDQISIYNGSFNLNAGADQTICTGKSAVLNATGGNNYSWNTGATTSTITVSPTINTTYTVTATNIYGCTASDQVAVAVNTTVTPTFTTPAATCSGGTSPLQTTSNNGILGTWLPAFNNAETTTYTFTPTVGQCATTATMTITVNPVPTSPTASASQTFCASPAPTIASLTANGTALKWYATLIGGAALASATPLVTGTTYYASQTIGTCESTRTAVVVTITPITAPTAVAQTFCASATVANLIATGTAIKWYANLIGGAALVSTTALVTGTTYYASQTIGTCESTRTAVAVTITPTIAPTAIAQTFCTSATVANLVATGTALKWYAAATGGTVLANTTALLTGTTYYASQTVGTCESTRTAVNVTVTQNVTPTFTQVPPICSGAILTELPTTSNNGITGTWSPLPNNLNPVADFGSGFNGTIYKSYTYNNQIICFGDFTTYNGTNICKSVAKLNLDGTFISGFTGTTDVIKENVILLNDGTFIIAGINNANGIDCTTSLGYIIKFNNNFTQNTTFNSGRSGFSSNIGNVRDIIKKRDDSEIRISIDRFGIEDYDNYNGVNFGSSNPYGARELIINSNGDFTRYSQIARSFDFVTYANNDTRLLYSNVETGPIPFSMKIIGDTNFSMLGVSKALELNNGNLILKSFDFNFYDDQYGVPINSFGIISPTGSTLVQANSGTGLSNENANMFTDGEYIYVYNGASGVTYNGTAVNKLFRLTQNLTIDSSFNCTTSMAIRGMIFGSNDILVYGDSIVYMNYDGTIISKTQNTQNPIQNTLTFTPTAGQCATTATMTIVVNPNITPTFTQIAPICSGGTLLALPTTSNNGITGNWTPAINNTKTTLYTFSRTAGQCATTATMTIVVNPNITPTFTQVAPICSGGTLPALPTTSNNGITGNWTPAINNTKTTLYTFTPTAGQCASTTTQTITITAPKVTSAISFVSPVAALPSVTIGTQVWTNKNLDVTTYRDGTPIPQVTDPTAWASLTTGAWCYYNNDPANGAIYGKLYNWYAVAGIHDSDPNTPNKILAPVGWHVPTNDKWTTLTTFLGDSAGNTMKAATGWTPNIGITNTNSSGFTGLPGGYRNRDGVFVFLGGSGAWWSVTESGSTYAGSRFLYYNNSNANVSFPDKQFGFSVRCLKD